MLRMSHRTVNVRQSNKRLSTTSTLCNFGRQMKIGLAAKGLNIDRQFLEWSCMFIWNYSKPRHFDQTNKLQSTKGSIFTSDEATSENNIWCS